MQEALIKIIAMPSDTDTSGRISTSWLLKQLDLAAGVVVKELTGQRSVTISMDQIHFIKPILVGDYVLCYAEILRLGKSAIHINLRVDVKRLDDGGFSLHSRLVTAKATFVSLDKEGKKVALDEYRKDFKPKT